MNALSSVPDLQAVVPVRRLMLVIAVLTSMSLCAAQERQSSGPPGDVASLVRHERQTLTITFGAELPESKSGLREFWLHGPSGSVNFFVNVNRWLALGIGLDASLFYFDQTAFVTKFPAITLQTKNVALGNLYIGMKYTPAPMRRLSPFVAVALGATRMTEAVYQDIVNGKRQTYYDIPGRTRLALGLSGGADLYLSRLIAIEVVAKTSFVNNDQDIGIALALRGGIRFTL
jgi:hypothetical protein